MKITYNLQVLPQRKNSRKDSEETTALKAFLADSEKKNMVFEYDTPQEATRAGGLMLPTANAGNSSPSTTRFAPPSLKGV